MKNTIVSHPVLSLLAAAAFVTAVALVYQPTVKAVDNYNAAHQPQVFKIGPGSDPVPATNVVAETTHAAEQSTGNGEELTPEEDATLMATPPLDSRIKEALGSFGKNWKVITGAIGVPDETRPSDGQVRYTWKATNTDLYLTIEASFNESDQKISYLTLHTKDGGAGLFVSALKEAVNFPAHPIIRVHPVDTSFHRFCIFGKLANGEEVRIYAGSEMPLTEAKPYLDSNGLRQERVAAFWKFSWEGSQVELIAVGNSYPWGNGYLGDPLSPRFSEREKWRLLPGR